MKTKTTAQKLTTARNKCDALLTPIIKKIHPRCESCGRPTEVAHHWKEKSISSILRYDIRNLIPLCHSCHAKIHNRFGNSVTGAYDVADIIIKKRGIEWKNTLDRDARDTQKVNLGYYKETYERLCKLEK